MGKRYILLQGLQTKGGGVASISDSNVTVSTNNCNGKFEIWLLKADKPEERIKAGDIKGGSAARFCIDPKEAERIDTVLLTQNKNPVMAGTLARRMPSFQAPKEPRPEKKEEKKRSNSPLGEDTFTWREISDGSYPDTLPIIRHIFNNIVTIRRISKYRTYFYGTHGNKVAVAIPSSPEEANAFPHLADCALYSNGYWVVCADKKDAYFYSYEF